MMALMDHPWATRTPVEMSLRRIPNAEGDRSRFRNLKEGLTKTSCIVLKTKELIPSTRVLGMITLGSIGFFLWVLPDRDTGYFVSRQSGGWERFLFFSPFEKPSVAKAEHRSQSLETKQRRKEKDKERGKWNREWEVRTVPIELISTSLHVDPEVMSP